MLAQNLFKAFFNAILSLTDLIVLSRFHLFKPIQKRTKTSLETL